MAGELTKRFPESWRVCRLDEVTALIDSLHKTPVYSRVGRPMVRVTDVQGGFLDVTKALRVTENVFQEFTRRYTPKRGDIVFSRVGTYGNASYANTDIPFCLGQNTALLSPRINGRFLHLFLQSIYARQQIEQVVVGSTQKTISLKSICALQIPIPPATEIEAIAHILGSLDDKIELNRRMNETLEEMARALFNSWFVDFDPVRAKAKGREPGLPKYLADLFPARFEVSELGEIPEGWRVSKLGREVTIVLGGTPSRAVPAYWGGEIPWINSGKANEFRVVEPSEFITEAGLHSSATKLLPPRTTVIAITGATLGQISLTEIEVCANQSIAAVLDTDALPSEFLYFWTKEHVEDLVASQTGGAQQHINKNNVNELAVLCPSAGVLSVFLGFSRPIFDRIKACCFESRTLAALRDALLPKLITGELRLKDAEKLVARAL